MSENGNYMDAVPGGACGSCDTTTWRVLLNRVEHPVLESWAQDFNITRAEAVVHHLEMVISVAKMALEVSTITRIPQL